MAFGVKTKNIKTQNSYTIESFFDAIKDKELRQELRHLQSMEWLS